MERNKMTIKRSTENRPGKIPAARPGKKIDYRIHISDISAFNTRLTRSL
jgi:hypothetical protein